MQSLNHYLAPILEAFHTLLDETPETTEHHLIKTLQILKIHPFEDFNLSKSKDLFSAHFLCMHALYHLKRNYEYEDSYRLTIESVRVLRHEKSNLSDQQLEYLLRLPEQRDPLEDYYLDAKHYFETHEDEINNLLRSFWTKYLVQDHKQAALETLQLPLNSDKATIKKQYKRLAQLNHPDKGGCIDRFKEIQAAKALLDKA